LSLVVEIIGGADFEIGVQVNSPGLLLWKKTRMMFFSNLIHEAFQSSYIGRTQKQKVAGYVIRPSTGTGTLPLNPIDRRHKSVVHSIPSLTGIHVSPV